VIGSLLALAGGLAVALLARRVRTSA
jgi:hypothetical protein